MLVSILCEGGRLLREAQEQHQQALNGLSPADRALAEQIVRTTLRRRGQLEHMLKRFLNKPLPRKACPVHAALLMGAAQLLAMRVPAHAAIHTTVALLKHERHLGHFSGLANAVLRRLHAEGEMLLRQVDAALNIPEWLRQRWRQAWGEEALREMVQMLLAEPPLDITVHDAETAAAWAERLHGTLLPTGSVRIMHPQGPVPELPGYDEGAWWVQDAAAALPAHLLAAAFPQADISGRSIADLCAAPGGKTAQLVSRGARVQAVDISARRLRRLHENLKRLKLADKVEVVEADVLQWHPATAPDAILLDAPCTATGTFRRHPDVLQAKSPAQLAALAELQRQMLQHAAHQIAPGGVLVYCVCSLLPEEGEEQVERFLASKAGQAFRRLPVSPAEIAHQHQFITAAGDVRTLPHQPIGSSTGLDGFFIARLQRTE